MGRSRWILGHPKGEPTEFADILDEGGRWGSRLTPSFLTLRIRSLSLEGSGLRRWSGVCICACWGGVTGDRVQDMVSQKGAPWHAEYFKLKMQQKGPSGHSRHPLSLRQVIKPSCKRCPHHAGTKKLPCPRRPSDLKRSPRKQPPSLACRVPARGAALVHPHGNTRAVSGPHSLEGSQAA